VPLTYPTCTVVVVLYDPYSLSVLIKASFTVYVCELIAPASAPLSSPTQKI
jgi:hypothetical protein